MTDRRSIAYDATFTILFIGLSAALSVLSLVLLAFVAFGVEFGGLQAGAAVLNIVGWMLLPFAPRLYRRLVGHPFSWRANSVLGGQV